MQSFHNSSIFFIWGSFVRHGWFTAGNQGKGGNKFFASLQLSLSQELSDIYLLFCIWNDYLQFSNAGQVITSLSLDQIFQTLGIRNLLNY